MGALDRQTGELTPLATQLRTRARPGRRRWPRPTRANVERFTAARPDWAKRLDEKALNGITPDAARPLTAELLAELGPATTSDLDTAKRGRPAPGPRQGVVRGRLPHGRARGCAPASPRPCSIPWPGGSTWRSGARREEREAYEALRRCEAVAFPPVPLPEALQLARTEPFPPLDDDLALANRVTPAWMGIQFKQASDTARAAKDLPVGAARVVAVYDGSPARAAGLRIGDLVLGPPGRHFAEPDQIREWTMLSPVGEPARLDVQRETSRIAVTLTPERYPQHWPSLPGPPKVGSTAPPLRLDGYRGSPPTSLATGRPHLLFFWATWCSICKAALPEVDAFARERGATVVAITDEDRSRLDPFFTQPPKGFPASRRDGRRPEDLRRLRRGGSADVRARGRQGHRAWRHHGIHGGEGAPARWLAVDESSEGSDRLIRSARRVILGFS